MRWHSFNRTRSASRRWGLLGLTALLSGTLILGACAEDDGDGDEATETTTVTTTATQTETPTETATETATATETETPTPTNTAPEPVEREGISFVAPEGWVGNADTWTSPDGAVTLLFATTEREPGTEPEAVMLPAGAVNLDREEVDTSIGSGGIHTVELTEQDVYERHAIITTEDRIYDWWLAAETVEELDAQDEALRSVLDSVLAAEDA